MTNQKKLQKLFERLDEIEAFRRTLGKMSFDQSCTAPEEGMAQAGADMAIVSKTVFKLTHHKTFERLIRELYADSEGLTDIQKKTVEHLYEGMEKNQHITAAFSFDMNKAFNAAYGAWLNAKRANDFALYEPSITTLIDYTRKEIDLRKTKYPTYYTALLDDYEKGNTEEVLDAFFASLKARIVPLVTRIVKEGKPIREDFLTRPVAIGKQEEFSRYLLALQGLRESALVLATTEHPFTTNFGPCDVRVTTHYYEDNFISNIFSTLHEGGHAMFMQNEPDEVYENHCANHMSNAMHETISRFYENIIGRSEAFVSFVSPKLRELSGNTFDDVSDRELYEAVNIARPSLIRTEADELTYSMHILIRYEIEKAFINGTITPSEIPALWQEKYREYLGVEVKDDAVGCLQDVHWTGMFGYFPSYALGNAYGAQILHTMQKDFSVYDDVRRGDLSRIAAWLKEKVYRKASLLTPDEWIRDITGESLSVDYYLDYLENKYKTLYGLI
ncbi:MAG: carboxypeptidase M32 [Clostridia bacterium]|nr:carboxypeptidase M32 [Clostridia bacterium]